MLEIGRVIADRYEITEKIGSGGMSIVYKALDRKLNRPVSFKVLREEYSVDEEFRKRFIREARSVASLSHQNIVNVYDVGQENEINYIVMEFIAGMTLKELITKRAPFMDQEVLGVAIQITAALIHAHNSKIIHRDIKPQNVIVTGKGVIKVTDFGIARKTDSDSATMGGSTTLGSVHYFSPEQAKGIKADPKSDLYSLGIVMFEMLTGELPYDADTAVSVALMQINEPLPDMTEYNPDVNPKVKSIVEKLTEKNPEQRYQTAEILLKDLKAVIANPDAVLSFESDGSYRRSRAARPDADSGYGLEPDGYGYDDDGDDYEDDGYVRDSDEDDDDRRPGYPPHKPDSKRRPKTPAYREAAKPAYRDKDGGYDKSYDKGYDKRKGYDDYDGKGRRDKHIIILGILTAVALAALALVLLLPNILDRINPPAPTDTLVAVPKLENVDYETAKTELSGLGLVIAKAGERYSDNVPAGAIIEAKYDEGDKINKGTVVEVIVSLGQNLVEVPALTGMDTKAAYTKLEELGLPVTIKEQFEFNDTFQTNMIYDQSPKAGEKVLARSEVTIYISKGKEHEKFTMPNLTGMTISRALDELDDLGLLPGNITRRYSDTVAKDFVMQHAPAEGKDVYLGNTVGFVVSDGPEPAPEETPAASESPGPGITDAPDITPLKITPTPTPTESAGQQPSPTPAQTYTPVQTAPPNVAPTVSPYYTPTPTPAVTYMPPPTPTPTPVEVVIPTEEPPVVVDPTLRSGDIVILESYLVDNDLKEMDYARVVIDYSDPKTRQTIIVFDEVIFRFNLPKTVTVTGKIGTSISCFVRVYVNEEKYNIKSIQTITFED